MENGESPLKGEDVDGGLLQGIVTEEAGRLLNENDEKEKLSRWQELGLPLNPKGKLNKFWDTLVGLTLLYTALVSVWVISFYGVLWVDSGFFWIERLIDFIWVVDICLSFVTSYRKPDMSFEKSLRKCAVKYVSTWFVVDVLSTIPWDIISYVGDKSEYFLVLRLLRLLRMSKIIRLFRLFGNTNTLVKLEVFFAVKHAVLRIILLVVFAMFVSHWVACLFYFFAYVQVEDQNGKDFLGDGRTWIGDPFINANNNFEFYIAALYFSVYTITTIGFGDVTPVSTIERIYTIVIMLIGAAIFTYILSNVNALVEDMNLKGQQFRLLMDQMMDYATERHLDPEIHFKVRKHFRNIYGNSRLENDERLLNSMPLGLRTDVTTAVYGPLLRKLEWFNDVEESILGPLCSRARQRTMGPNEDLFKVGDEADGFFVIIVGEVIVSSKEDTFQYHLHDGDAFGINHIVLGRPRDQNARSVKLGSYVYFNRSDVLDALVRAGKYEQVERNEVRGLWRRALTIAEGNARFSRIASTLWKRTKELKKEHDMMNTPLFENGSRDTKLFDSELEDPQLPTTPSRGDDEDKFEREASHRRTHSRASVNANPPIVMHASARDRELDALKRKLEETQHVLADMLTALENLKTTSRSM